MEMLDRTDGLILRELQRDAKLTTKELAAKVNLSPSPTFERQKRLEREGYIKLVSENQHHAEKEVALSRVRAIALVKASVRMNTMR